MSQTLRIETPRAFLPLLRPARYKGAHGGRGSAKSWFFAGLLVEEHVANPELRSVCVREVQRSLDQSVKRLLEDRIQQLGVGHLFRVLNTHIETGQDGRILFQGMQQHTAESIKSLEGYRRAWVEEAQSLSQRSLDLLRPTIRGEDSEIWFSWNPRYATDPVDAFLRSGTPPPDAVVVQATYRDNPWLPDVLRREMEWDKARDFEKYEHVWLGKYERHSEARVFKNWTVVDDFDPPPGTTFYYGADWGFATDPTVLVRVWIEGRTLYIDREVYQVGCEIDHTPALFDTLDGGYARRWDIVADSARPETISYVKRHGYPRIMNARKGAGSVEDGVAFLQSYDIKVCRRCVNAIRELTDYSYKRDKLTEAITPVLEDKKNHVIDAIRYAVESIRKPTQVVAAIMPNKKLAYR